MSEPSNNNGNSNDGGQGDGAGAGGGDDGKGGGSSTQNNQGGNQNQQQQGNQGNVDLKSLPADQIAGALENPELWKTPRMQELLNSSKELKDLKAKADADEETRLKESKKFEELAEKKEQENSTLKAQMQTMQSNQALTSLLVKENVVDLDGALKLVDRSKITVKDDGTVEGAEDAISALKTDKAYLFNNQNNQNRGVGTPSNQGNQNQSNGGQTKFKRSQLVGPEGTKFYQDNKAEIDAAYAAGLIEDDVSPR